MQEKELLMDEILELREKLKEKNEVIWVKVYRFFNYLLSL